MYMNENSHKFPALVLAAGLTTAVVIGLSALAQSRPGIAPDIRQGVDTMPSVTQAVAADAMIVPFRIDVIATRSQPGSELQTVAASLRSRQPG
jgi:hypothetical protein